MEDITYDKITVCHFKLERMEGLIDSYIIHIYKLPEMDDVVESDIGQMHMEGDRTFRFCFLNSYFQHVKPKP